MFCHLTEQGTLSMTRLRRVGACWCIVMVRFNRLFAHFHPITLYSSEIQSTRTLFFFFFEKKRRNIPLTGLCRHVRDATLPALLARCPPPRSKQAILYLTQRGILDSNQSTSSVLHKNEKVHFFSGIRSDL